MRDRLRKIGAWLVHMRERLLDPPAGAFPGPRPDELLWLGACMLSGIPTLLGAPPTSVVDALLWAPLLYVWAAALVALPIILVWTSLARWRGVDGQGLIEAAVMFRRASRLLAIACLVYIVSAATRAGWAAAIVAGMAGGFALARLWRSYEMGRWLARYRIRP